MYEIINACAFGSLEPETLSASDLTKVVGIQQEMVRELMVGVPYSLNQVLCSMSRSYEVNKSVSALNGNPQTMTVRDLNQSVRILREMMYQIRIRNQVPHDLTNGEIRTRIMRGDYKDNSEKFEKDLTTAFLGNDSFSVGHIVYENAKSGTSSPYEILDNFETIAKAAVELYSHGWNNGHDYSK